MISMDVQVPPVPVLNDLLALVTFLGLTDQAEYLKSLKSEVERVNKARADLAEETSAAKDLLDQASALRAEIDRRSAANAQQADDIAAKMKAAEETQRLVAQREQDLIAAERALAEKASETDRAIEQRKAELAILDDDTVTRNEAAKSLQAQAVARLAKIKEIAGS
jgi:chromosome segregation ATPase